MRPSSNVKSVTRRARGPVAARAPGAVERSRARVAREHVDELGAVRPVRSPAAARGAEDLVAAAVRPRHDAASGDAPDRVLGEHARRAKPSFRANAPKISRTTASFARSATATGLLPAVEEALDVASLGLVNGISATRRRASSGSSFATAASRCSRWGVGCRSRRRSQRSRLTVAWSATVHATACRIYAPVVDLRSVDELENALRAVDHLPDRGLATALFLRRRSRSPCSSRARRASGRRRRRRRSRGPGRAPDPAPVLRGTRRRPRGLRVELHAPAPAHPRRPGGHGLRAELFGATSSSAARSSRRSTPTTPSSSSSTRSIAPTRNSRRSCSRCSRTSRSRSPSSGRSARGGGPSSSSPRIAPASSTTR